MKNSINKDNRPFDPTRGKQTLRSDSGRANPSIRLGAGRQKKWLIAGVVFLFFCFLVFFSVKFIRDKYFSHSAEIKAVEEVKAEDVCAGCLPRLIDGVFVKTGEENIFPVAVMIDNHSDARPAFGLSKANLVFEAKAEGGITRYLAIFADDSEADDIGPVRSARPYYIDWAMEFGAIYAHCGGSPEALVKIKKDSVSDLNEYYNGGYFWRDNRRVAPHNVLTSSELLNKYREANDYEAGDYESWKYKYEKTENRKQKTEEDVMDIEIGFIYPYNSKWVYDAENNEYIRYLAGALHKDNSGEQIKAKNVVIMKTEAEVLDEYLRLEMRTLGTGEAIVCLDGKCEAGEWRKPSKIDRTRFYRQNGDEFEFNPGTTWVSVVTEEMELVY